MGQISLSRVCGACIGTGIRKFNATPGGPLVTEDPCSICGGDGRVISLNGIDDTLFLEMNEKLDYIKTKVKKIWNKVKDGAPEE